MLKNKKGQSDFGRIILIFVGVIFAIALIGAIFQYQSLATTKQTTYNETEALDTLGCVVANADGGQVNESSANCNLTSTQLTYAVAATDWRASDSQCDLSSVVVTNGSLYTFTEGTDYNLFNQSIQFLNATTTRAGAVNDTNITYSFCDSGYNKDAGSRNIAGLWGLFAALALMAFVMLGIRNDWFK